MRIRSLYTLLFLFAVPITAEAQWNIMLTSDTMNYTGVTVLDRNTAWMVGNSGENSSLYYTPDGGLQFGGGIFSGRHLTDITSTEAGIIIAVGSQYDCDCASILVGQSTGGTFSSAFYESVERFNAVEFYDNLHGIITANGSSIVYTEDGGQTWTLSVAEESIDFLELDIPERNRAYAIGALRSGEALPNKVYGSTDGGATWKLLYDHTADGAEMSAFHDIAFSDGMTGFMAGESNGPIVTMTTDGGVSWSEVFTPENGPSSFLSVTTTGMDTVYAGGDDGSIWASYDGGATWARDRTLFDAPVYALDFRDGVGWGTGPGGSFYKTVKAVGPEGYCLPPVTGPVYGSGILAVSLDASPPIARASTSDEYYTWIAPEAERTPKIARGGTYTFTMVTDPSNIDGRNSSNVWIDFNQDGDFDDDGEDVAIWDLHDPATEMKWTFVVPADAAEGKTIMRVFTDMPGEFGHDVPNPCGYAASDNILGHHGEVEDYAIEIISGDASSVGSEEADQRIRLTGDRLELRGVSSGGTMTILDITGKAAYRTAIESGSSVIELPDLPHGTWLLDLVIDGERHLRRVER